MNKKKIFLIIAILTLGIFLRIWDFGNNPPGVTDDEASLGYNAYSLLQTGKDEYGKTLPILIRSFGTYASGLYTYMTTVPVWLFGLNPVSVRMTSLFSGIILIYASIYLFGPITGLVIAISPVFVFYSRSTFEANLALSLLLLGIALAKKRSIPFSFLFISLSAYAYHAERVISLILMVILFWYFYKVQGLKKTAIVSLAIGLILQIPILWISFSSGANARISTLGYTGGIVERFINYSYLYSAYFSPNNIFNRPDPSPNKFLPNLGTFYWWMIFPFVIGIIKIIKKREYKSIPAICAIILIVVSPGIAATTRDYFSTWRVLPMFVSFAWFISRGIQILTTRKMLIYSTLILLSVFELYSSLVILKNEYSIPWGYQYKKLAEFVRNTTKESVVVDNSRSGSIYIWLAFYNLINPKEIQSKFDTAWLSDYYNNVKFDPNMKINNVDIRPIVWKRDIYQEEILISDVLGISDSQAQEHFLEKIGQINDINGKADLMIFRTNPVAKCLSIKYGLDSPCQIILKSP